jgi:cytoskeletal protein CcmA (bactofilin family)
MFHTGRKAEAALEQKPEEGSAMREYSTQRGGRPSTGEATLNALLGPGSVVEGKVSFQGQVRIDGRFTGEITTTDLLIIGEQAKVAAEISCGSAVVSGEVTGNITATASVELHQPARVTGAIATPSLSIDKGVVFNGISKMECVERTS